jgi:hypothetical protein
LTRSWPALLVLAISGWAASCGTTYQPRPSPRIGLVIHHGAAFYIKDGQEVVIGPLGGALEPLVASSPPALARAHRGYLQLAFGVPLYVGGAASVLVGLLTSRVPLKWTLVGAGAACAGTGLGLIGTGFLNAVDAVNIYNDSVAPAGPGP